MSRYREMEIFDAVARAGSLASAARHMELSQATVIRTMTILEGRLGCALLIRSPRGVNLSPEGELFATRCRLILQDIADADRSVRGIHTNPAGHLTVSLPLLMTHQVFMPIALEYLQAFPDVQVLTRSRENTPKLLEEGIDVALVVGHLPDSSGFAIPIGTVKPLICGSPEYLNKWGRPNTPEDIKAHRTILTSSMDHLAEWRQPYSSSCRPFRSTPVLTCTTRHAAIQAAVSGLGLTQCMSYEAHQELHSGLLEPVLERFATPNLPAQLMSREGRKASARVRTFLDFAVPRLRAHPAFHH